MIVLGLGSNIGDKLDFITEAVRILSDSVLAAPKISPVYESRAIVKPNSPDEWQQKFLNMAMSGETHLSPLELLNTVKMIEKRLGRQERGRWAPREIDIDILAYGSDEIEVDGLSVPHKDLIKRPFALKPLVDVEPNWQYPVEGAFFGKTAYQINEELYGNAVFNSGELAQSDLVLDITGVKTVA